MRLGGYSNASIAVTTASVVALATLGARLTDTGPWYRMLRKPSFQPPDFLFAPAWTLIFVCLGSAVVIAWNAPGSDAGQRTAIAIAAAVNFLLNSLWSFLFFHRRRPDLAFVEVIVFWASIVVLMLVVRPLSTTAVWLLMPYLAWVSFATVLNQRIVALNAPFSQS